MHENTQQIVEQARPMNRTRVMIVDDHQVVRAGLRTMINGQPDLAVQELERLLAIDPAATEVAEELHRLRTK